MTQFSLVISSNDVLAFEIKIIKNPIKIAVTKSIKINQRIIFHQKFIITRPVFTKTLKLSKNYHAFRKLQFIYVDFAFWNPGTYVPYLNTEQ